MPTRKISRQGLQAERHLREAVREEFKRKAMLGQYVIINRNGKSCKVPAEEALQEAMQEKEKNRGRRMTHND